MDGQRQLGLELLNVSTGLTLRSLMNHHVLH